MVNKWSDNDEGFILGDFGSEFTPLKKMSKRDPKTRHLRPQEEWTPADVASEFSSRAYTKLRGIPGVINTKALWGALAANRKKYNITAVIELEALERFFADERNFVALRKNPKSAHGMFLNAITSQIHNIEMDLDMGQEPIEQEVASSTEFVYASDGTEFDNSMAGRLDRKEYEARLKKEN
jgi:hypothetical protein